jgi:hypothetical protein
MSNIKIVIDNLHKYIHSPNIIIKNKIKYIIISLAHQLNKIRFKQNAYKLNISYTLKYLIKNHLYFRLHLNLMYQYSWLVHLQYNNLFNQHKIVRVNSLNSNLTYIWIYLSHIRRNWRVYKHTLQHCN